MTSGRRIRITDLREPELTEIQRWPSTTASAIRWS
jgi:hypothetical protein